jgi:hypothetical protein
MIGDLQVTCKDDGDPFELADETGARVTATHDVSS